MARRPKAVQTGAARATVADEQPSATSETPAPTRRGRKPQQPTGAAAASPLWEKAKPANGRRGRKQRQTATDPVPDRDGAPTSMAIDQRGVAASNEAAGRGSGPGQPGGETVQPTSDLGSAVPPKPAAKWDRATNTVRFDWPEIERTASQDGPNQGLAKLLIAARAEGANSRWPL